MNKETSQPLSSSEFIIFIESDVYKEMKLGDTMYRTKH